MWDFIKSIFSSEPKIYTKEDILKAGFTETFESVSFQNADLSGVEIKHMKFKQVDFRGVNFDKANLSMCTFENCDFGNSTWIETTSFSTDFTGCAFSEVRFEEARFSSGKLLDCTFERTVFIQVGFGAFVDFTGSQFTNPEVQDSEFHLCRGIEGLAPVDLYSKPSNIPSEERSEYFRKQTDAIARSLQGNIRIDSDSLFDVPMVTFEKNNRNYKCCLGVTVDLEQVVATDKDRYWYIYRDVTDQGDPSHNRRETGGFNWDDIDPIEQKYYLDKHIYMEDYPDALEKFVSMWESSSPMWQRTCLSFMNEHNIEHLDASQHVIAIGMEVDVLDADYFSILKQLIEFLEQVEENMILNH